MGAGSDRACSPLRCYSGISSPRLPHDPPHPPAVTATGTTFWAAIAVRSRLAAKGGAVGHPHAVCGIDRAAVAKKRAGERLNDALRP
jgi:hypothetical protein